MQTPATGFPELTELGKQIEVLRIERGLSKQALAKIAGTSRQQLWRVMTGKSELTAPLKIRLADALHVHSFAVRDTPTRSTTTTDLARAAAVDIASYLADAAAIEGTLRTMPDGDAGRALKRRYLDLLEECAMHERRALDAAFFELRRRVVAGEL
ncbi:MAG TPA: helix-turn-helix transcriptional regulator [Gemmatimonadaceae bacterium]|nr:helix-turn-helix transcriptional regulator [Gemmatimonadaceae bacterium]